jgi:hypothetical protein
MNSIINTKSSFLKYPWDKYATDVLVLLLYFTLLHTMIQWQINHLLLSCTLLMLFNIAAMAMSCFSFFTGFSSNSGLIKYNSSLSSFERAAIGLSAFLSCLGFFWWLVPFAAVNNMGVKETGFILGMGAYFIVFMAIVAGSITNKKAAGIARLQIFRIANSVITAIFFFFSYSFLLVTLPHWHSSFILAPYLAILCLAIFYLPLRFFLILRPPFHKYEYYSFILMFGFLLYRLFVELAP